MRLSLGEDKSKKLKIGYCFFVRYNFKGFFFLR